MKTMPNTGDETEALEGRLPVAELLVLLPILAEKKLSQHNKWFGETSSYNESAQVQ